MARGKQKGVVSLKDTVPDSEIVRKGEVRNEPNYIFPDGNFGITGKYADYSLVTKRIAYRTGTEDDKEDCGKVIEYTVWEDYPCYMSTIEGIFKSYAKINNLSEFKRKKLMTEMNELVNIHRSTDDKITKALGTLDTFIDRTQEEILSLADTKQKLLEDIKELTSIKYNLKTKIDDIDKMYADIKDKHKIIVENMPKQKKHPIKEEEA